MSGWLPEADIAYRWEAELGGRRSPREDSHLALRIDGFWRLLPTTWRPSRSPPPSTTSSGRRAARPCGALRRGLWWNCHRRLLADALVLRREIRVEHLLPDGRITPHEPTEACAGRRPPSSTTSASPRRSAVCPPSCSVERSYPPRLLRRFAEIMGDERPAHRRGAPIAGAGGPRRPDDPQRLFHLGRGGWPRCGSPQLCRRCRLSACDRHRGATRRSSS